MNWNGNGDKGVNRLFEKVASEKKKTGIALCLIAIMTLMWARVLTNEGPETSEASPSVETIDANADLDEVINLAYVDLPEVEGRNNMISRDFFASAGWEDFRSNDLTGEIFDVQDVSTAKTDNTQEVAEIVKQHVSLEVIDIGQMPRAFINGKLVSEGDRLVVTDGDEMYECEVVEITKNRVLIRCKDAEIVLKLIEPVEGDG